MCTCKGSQPNLKIDARNCGVNLEVRCKSETITCDIPYSVPERCELQPVTYEISNVRVSSDSRACQRAGRNVLPRILMGIHSKALGGGHAVRVSSICHRNQGLRRMKSSQLCKVLVPLMRSMPCYHISTQDMQPLGTTILCHMG